MKPLFFDLHKPAGKDAGVTEKSECALLIFR